MGWHAVENLNTESEASDPPSPAEGWLSPVPISEATHVAQPTGSIGRVVCCGVRSYGCTPHGSEAQPTRLFLVSSGPCAVTFVTVTLSCSYCGSGLSQCVQVSTVHGGLWVAPLKLGLVAGGEAALVP